MHSIAKTIKVGDIICSPLELHHGIYCVVLQDVGTHFWTQDIQTKLIYSFSKYFVDHKQLRVIHKNQVSELFNILYGD